MDRETRAIARMTDAARIWFVLQYFGARCFILNGGRAALAAAALRAGHADVRVYHLGFADWARDKSCPVTRGRPPG